MQARKVNPKNFLTELKRRNVYRAAVATGSAHGFSLSSRRKASRSELPWACAPSFGLDRVKDIVRFEKA